MADSQEQLSTGNGAPRDSSSHLYKTFVWQKRCLWSLVFAYLVSIPNALLGFVIGLFCFGLYLVMCLHLYRAARDAGGAGYAVAHVALAVVSFPFGLFVPFLVRADIAKGTPARWKTVSGRYWVFYEGACLSGVLVGALIGMLAFGGVVNSLLGAFLGLLVGNVVFNSIWRSRATRPPTQPTGSQR